MQTLIPVPSENLKENSGSAATARTQARKRIRTADPFLTMEVLYQLSYPGIGGETSASPETERLADGAEWEVGSTPGSICRPGERRPVVTGLITQVEGLQFEFELTEGQAQLAHPVDQRGNRIR